MSDNTCTVVRVLDRETFWRRMAAMDNQDAANGLRRLRRKVIEAGLCSPRTARSLDEEGLLALWDAASPQSLGTVGDLFKSINQR